MSSIRPISFLLLLSLFPLHELFAQESADQLARDFYNTYLDNLPDPRIQKKELLEANLLQSLKRIIPGSDPFEGGPAYAASLTAKDLSYARVDRTDPFVRGILKEIPQLKVEEFMFIVRSGPYMIFLCYRADPYRYRVRETDDFYLVRKRPTSDQNSPLPGNSPGNTNDGRGHEPTPAR